MSYRTCREKVLGLMLAVSAAALAGCQDYNKSTGSAYNAFESGDYKRAALEATDKANKADSHNRVVYRLEQGACERAAGQMQSSNEAFGRADGQISQYDQEPELKVSQEVIAAMYNATALDYRGYQYDRIMMNTYEALNCMEQGDLERARVELNRAYQRQQEAVDKYKAKIEANNQVQQQKRSDYDVDRAENDPKFKQQMDTDYSDVQTEDLSAYKDYVNPFTEYLRGLYLMAAGGDASDLEQAATAMRRVAGMVRDNSYVAEDMQLADAVANGKPIEPTTYVIYEAGLAPERGEIVIHIPLFLVTNRIDYAGAAFPKLKKRRCAFPELEVRTSGGSYRTKLVCDMDKVVAQEFKNELPIVITRTLISAGTKAAADYAVNQATRSNGIANAVARIGTAVYQVSVNHADLRTWRTLPKQFSVARFSTPADRQLTLSLPDGHDIGTLQLEHGVVNVVFVKIVDNPGAAVIRQFSLK
jgi:uncharacterized protein